MRILSITAGAAGMYCGSCFRDNALAAELLKRGHDAHLVPVYTPTRTDEPNVSERRVLFGGISVYLQQSWPLFRRLPRFLDRVWDAPGVIGAFANRSVSSTDPKLLGELTVATLEGTSASWPGSSTSWSSGRATSRRPTSSTCPIRCSSPWRRRSRGVQPARCAARCRARSCSSTACCRRIASGRSS